jgi:hypothetical protein
MKRAKTTGWVLMAMLVCGSHAIAQTPGEWTGSAEFGSLAIEVNETSTAVLSLNFGFSGWTCGPTTVSGGVKISSSGWSISGGAFSITLTVDPGGNQTVTIAGTFTGNEAAGTWDANSYGTLCSGTWQAVAPGTTAVEDDSIVDMFRLEQNYPNPFNPTTVIQYATRTSASVRLSVFDEMGRLVRDLDQGHKTAGSHEVMFDAADLSPGVYFYRIQIGELSETRRMVLLK